jgi:hypothetical protein
MKGVLMTAKTVQINSRGKVAKIRNPWLVVLFSVLTLGIYYLFWYYFVNREMCDWGEERKTDIGLSPGVSVVAITLGGFIIVPPFVSLFRTGKRMQLSQRVADVHGGSGLLFFFLSIIPVASILAPAYLQTELNKVWETRQAPVATEATETRVAEIPVAPGIPPEALADGHVGNGVAEDLQAPKALPEPEVATKTPPKAPART